MKIPKQSVLLTMNEDGSFTAANIIYDKEKLTEGKPPLEASKTVSETDYDDIPEKAKFFFSVPSSKLKD